MADRRVAITSASGMVATGAMAFSSACSRIRSARAPSRLTFNAARSSMESRSTIMSRMRFSFAASFAILPARESRVPDADSHADLFTSISR